MISWHRSKSASCFRVRPALECLEKREVMYAATGDLWPHPELVTISFMPDDTNLGGVYSDLFAQFGSRFGSAAAWQNPMLKAAQTWARYTNLNFTVLADNGADSGSGDFQQGDPDFGDIRIGGFDFENSSFLAMAYLPPEVNNYSIGGDIGLNTGRIFNINGSDYDLYTVMLHEFGHALGLDHSATYNAVMYSAYQGVETGLYTDDINGIRYIYSGGSARSADAVDAVASNGNFGSATAIDALFDDETFIAQLPALDITTTSDLDYFTFTVPEGASSTMTIQMQSSGLSLLAPSLKVYNQNFQLVATYTGNGFLGSTLTAQLSVSEGQQYYIRAAGANTTAFGTGAYGLTVNLGTEEAPGVSPPDTQEANGDPLNGGGGLNDRVDAQGNAVQSLLNSLPIVGGFLSNLLRRLRPHVELPFVHVLTIGGHDHDHEAGDVYQATPPPSVLAPTPLPLRNETLVPSRFYVANAAAPVAGTTKIIEGVRLSPGAEGAPRRETRPVRSPRAPEESAPAPEFEVFAADEVASREQLAAWSQAVDYCFAESDPVEDVAPVATSERETEYEGAELASVALAVGLWQALRQDERKDPIHRVRKLRA